MSGIMGLKVAALNSLACTAKLPSPEVVITCGFFFCQMTYLYIPINTGYYQTLKLLLI